MWCNGCSQEKDAQAFYTYKNGKLRFPCIKCFVSYDAARKRSNPERTKAIARAGVLRRFYGTTPEEVARMEANQNGVCKICQKTCSSKPRLSIDHDHSTKQIRGLLCANCNHGWGHFKDSPDLLRKAAEYLESSTKSRS